MFFGFHLPSSIVRRTAGACALVLLCQTLSPVASAALPTFVVAARRQAPPSDGFNIEDIKSTRNEYVQKHSESKLLRNRARALARLEREKVARDKRVVALRAQLRQARLAFLAAQKQTSRDIKLLAQAKNGKPIGVLVEGQRVNVPYTAAIESDVYQTLRFALQTPQGTPIPNLAMRVRVRPDASVAGVERTIVSDEQGILSVPEIGPLPQQVEIDVAPVAATAAAPVSGFRLVSDTDEARSLDERAVILDANNEWRLSANETGVRSVLNPQGNLVTTMLPPRLVARATPSCVTIHRTVAAYTATQTARRRIKKYDASTPAPLVLERQVADVTIMTAPGSIVSLAHPKSATQSEGNTRSVEVVADNKGAAKLSLPLTWLDAGNVPLLVSQDLPGGTAETRVLQYNTDPYSANIVPDVQPQLARLHDVTLPGNIGVWSTNKDVSNQFGNPEKDRGSVAWLIDGSEWWTYPAQGMRFVMRYTPDNRLCVERIHLSVPTPPSDKLKKEGFILPSGAALGGVYPGMTVTELQAHWGVPDSIINTPSPPALNPKKKQAAQTPEKAQKTYRYLDNGLEAGVRDEKVVWVETTRKNELLLNGINAFEPRQPVTLFVESWEGNGRSSLPDQEALQNFLRRLPAVRLTLNRDEAQVILKGGVNDVNEERDNLLTPAIPLRYVSTVSIHYTLTQASTGRVLAEATETGSAGVNYEKEAALVGVGVTVLATKGKKLGQILAGVIGVASVSELQKAVGRAVNRCPAIATRTAVDKMIKRLVQTAEFSARVTGIDYEQGQVQLNVGSDQGIRVHSEEMPCEFALSVNGIPLSNENDDARTADYYTARVISVTSNSCICNLTHVERKVDKAREKFKEETSVVMTRLLPDPSTGLVAAQATARFVPMPLISETEMTTPPPKE